MWETAAKQTLGPGERAGHTCVVEEDLGDSSGGSILTFGGSYTVSGTPSRCAAGSAQRRCSLCDETTQY